MTSDDPRLQAASLPAAIRSAAVALNGDPHRYFQVVDDQLMVPLDRLRLTRARPDGIASAVRRMAEAATGARPRRRPINVSLRSDGLYDVVDGNSTVVAAAAAGWACLPCELV
jgi:hypothetical protein